MPSSYRVAPVDNVAYQFPSLVRDRIAENLLDTGEVEGAAVVAATGVVSVLAHGAVGDGLTDDADAINAALVDASNRGAAVVIPAGDYLVGSRIVLPANTHLIGYGATLHRASGLGTLMVNWVTGDTTTEGYDGPSNITVEGVTLDAHGDTLTANPANVLAFGHCQNVRVVGVTVLRTSGYHALELNAVDHAVVEGCRFLGFHEASGVTEKEAVQIDAAAPGDFGAADNTVAKNITIVGCTFGPYGASPAHHVGVGSHNPAGGFYDGIRVVGCTFSGLTDRAVGGHWWRGALISGNTVDITEAAAQGIRLTYSDAVSVIGNRVVVADAVTHASQGIGLSTSTVNSQAVGNYVGRASEGLYAGTDADRNVFSGNVTYRTNGPGITVNGGDDCVISGNHFNSCGYTAGTTGAIRVTGGSARASVTSNKVRPHGAGTEVTNAVSVNTGTSAFIFGNDIDSSLDISGGGGFVSATAAYRDASDRQLLTDRRTGWAAPTGTATRTTFATGSVTTAQLAERVKALIDDLTTHGLIGS